MVKDPNLYAVERGKVGIEQDFLASKKDHQLRNISGFGTIAISIVDRFDFAFENLQRFANERIVFEI